MVRVEVKATATIYLDGNYIELPVTFTATLAGGTETERNHEVYRMLKDACLGWNADYEVKVLD